MLSHEDFISIVRNTPLISIDLIVEDAEGRILLGWRNNLPAKGFWFVPGGRILKDEFFTKAFKRILISETGLNRDIEDASFLGIYEHLYPGENFADDTSFGTHYIVIAYRLKLDKPLISLPKEQHADYWWASLDEIMDDANVHTNTRNYFNGHLSFAG
jgi:colanic acid biosynthesis protein WcaH